MTNNDKSILLKEGELDSFGGTFLANVGTLDTSEVRLHSADGECIVIDGTDGEGLTVYRDG